MSQKHVVRKTPMIARVKRTFRPAIFEVFKLCDDEQKGVWRVAMILAVLTPCETIWIEEIRPFAKSLQRLGKGAAMASDKQKRRPGRAGPAQWNGSCLRRPE